MRPKSNGMGSFVSVSTDLQHAEGYGHLAWETVAASGRGATSPAGLARGSPSDGVAHGSVAAHAADIATQIAAAGTSCSAGQS